MGIRAAVGFLLGAVVGSFLALVLIRWPQRRSIWIGRSRCDACDTPLGPADLVPLVSYAVRHGRCRRCGAPIDERHFAIELAAALLGVVALVAHPGLAGLATALFGWWLLLLAAIDLEHHWLPDWLTLTLLPCGLLIGWAGLGAPLEQRVIGAVAGFAILAAIGWLYRRVRGRQGLGGGDPKLLAALGAWLGWQQLPLILLGAGLVGLAALAAMTARGEAVSGTDRLPLGTLMAIAAWPLWLVAAG